jgi:hypothetical protein
MYFWKIEKLKEDLSAGPLPEAESVKYVVAQEVLYALGMVPFLGVEDNNVWDVADGLVYLFLVLAGVLYAYSCNGRAKGRDFMQRYFAVGWVAGIRWMVMVLLPALVAYGVALGLYYGEAMPESMTPAEVVFLNVLCATYFWMLGRHLKDLEARGKVMSGSAAVAGK